MRARISMGLAGFAHGNAISLIAAMPACPWLRPTPSTWHLTAPPARSSPGTPATRPSCAPEPGCASSPQILALVFAGPVWMRFKQAGEWQAMVAVTGTVAFGLGWLAFAAQQVAFLTFVEYGNGEAMRLMLATGWDNWRYLCAGFLALAIAGTLAAMPLWFRILSVVVAAVQVVAMVPGSDVWLPAMIGFAYGFTVSVFVSVSPATSHPTR